tara:strand:- start:713 stop:1234 length:522 start_codon:yes stop_codon:yes gene_type:complete
MIEIIDDYLDAEVHDRLYNYWTGNYDQGDIANSCAWIFNAGINYPGDGHSQYIHLIYSKHHIISNAYNLIEPIVDKEDMSAIVRIKANAITQTEELVVFDWAFHCDFGPHADDMMTGIYYVNTNDGYTLFEDGTKVESVANRFVKFPATLMHTGTSCTDDYRRIVINFNYYAI